MSVNDVVAQIKDLNEQNIALQKRLGQAEQEVIRQRGAIEQSAQVVAALSLVAADSTQREKLAALRKESAEMLEDVRLCSETLQAVRKSTAGSSSDRKARMLDDATRRLMGGGIMVNALLSACTAGDICDGPAAHGGPSTPTLVGSLRQETRWRFAECFRPLPVECSNSLG